MTPGGKVPGSFRDKDGFLFYRDGVLYRQINRSYQSNYEYALSSGLLDHLIKNKMFIAHQEAPLENALDADAYKVIVPDVVPFISYPYEWSFSQLKDAALLTLGIQKKAMEYGMCLKDASAYNVQFQQMKPVFIDTLSLESYVEGRPWAAYRQFVEHFLAPLALMSFTDLRLGRLLSVYLDGIPLDLTCRLLPFRSCLDLRLLAHLHAHAKSQQCFSSKELNLKDYSMGRLALVGLIDNLESMIKSLKPRRTESRWGGYYEHVNKSTSSHKQALVAAFVKQVNPKNVWDLGSNRGVFTKLVARAGIPVVSFDMDAVIVEDNYNEFKQEPFLSVLPLILDLSNPSPALGWSHQERSSLKERGPVDLVLCLALVHHLVVTGNIPLNKIADFCQQIACSLVIEFIPQEDPLFKTLLVSKQGMNQDYSKELFEAEFGKQFNILSSQVVEGSSRTIYLMQNKKIPNEK